MTATLSDIIGLCEQLLEPRQFKDYCPNGLQVEGASLVTKIVSGVTASQELIEAAIAQGAQLILVHHGYFWKGESPQVVGMKRNRLKALLANDISLLAYHLPLDAHSTLGNNAQLADLLGLQIEQGMEPGNERSIGLIGRLPEPMSGDEFAAHIETKLGRKPLHIKGSEGLISRVAWCTGAAQGMIDTAAELQADAYLTGEISEPTVHSARELGLHFYAAGHHATERYGVQALGEYLSAQLGVEHVFVDIDNPV
ncbi:MAG: Nif3-like dinuclear metal center hexameric protein [Pseudomonadales bacterium]